MKPMQNIEDQVIAGNSNYRLHFGIARPVSSLNMALLRCRILKLY